jgi:RNA polymerase sigma-70 factor, ECF subfamily
MQIFEEPGFEEYSVEPTLDQEGVARLMLKQRMELTSYIQSIVRDIHMAEDVFQDVCVKAIKHHETFKDSLHLTKWTRRVARNRSIDCLRRKENQTLVLNEEALELLERDWPMEDEGPSPKKIEALRGCMGKMTPYSREILRLRYTEGLPGTQVADILNRKVDTIYKALTRIHMGLRDCVKRQLTGRGGEFA